MDPSSPAPLPMFPLGSVLVPSAVLPLQVFEPRYLALLDDVRASDGQEFGVVLIERGSEVGGGDVRTDVGTVARLARAEPLGDGRWAVASVGLRRIRVVEWLDDAPYPRALVVDWPDDDVPAAAGEPALSERYDRAVGLLRRSLALAAELGETVPVATAELTEDPARGSFQIVALAPVGPADRQELLAAPGVGARLDRALEVLGETIELLGARVALGADDE